MPRGKKWSGCEDCPLFFGIILIHQEIMAPFSHGPLKIAAFDTRIDKSKARRPSKADEATTSPYFSQTNSEMKNVTCSLLEHEAKDYGYKPDRMGSGKARRSIKGVTELKTQFVITKPKCKQYPRLLSRSLLDKYAHLFGLVPVAPIEQHDYDYNLESTRQSITPSADRRTISS